jgi:hypothetical protein
VSLHVGFRSPSDTALTTDFLYIAHNAFVERDFEVITTNTSPPSRLLHDAKLAVDTLSSLASLPYQLFVFVGVGEAVSDLDNQDKERRAKSPAKLYGHDSLKPQKRELPFKRHEDLICNQSSR